MILILFYMSPVGIMTPSRDGIFKDWTKVVYPEYRQFTNSLTYNPQLVVQCWLLFLLFFLQFSCCIPGHVCIQFQLFDCPSLALGRCSFHRKQFQFTEWVSGLWKRFYFMSYKSSVDYGSLYRPSKTCLVIFINTNNGKCPIP